MFRSVALLAVAVAVIACGGGERHDATTPSDDVTTCPSKGTPDGCEDLASTAAGTGNHQLAWAYTVLECQSAEGVDCVAMWRRFAGFAPSQTDALNVLHTACPHLPAACEQLATWHTERGHVLAAAAYAKRADPSEPPADPDASTPQALDAELAAIMHAQGAQPRTDVIDQQIGHAPPAAARPAPVAAAPPPRAQAWPIEAADLVTSSEACATTATADRHQVPLAKCIAEVPSLDNDPIVLRNRCGEAITVAFGGTRADHSTYTSQLQLEPYEALATGISHHDVASLTYAVCVRACVITSHSDDVHASWTGDDTSYFCTSAGKP